MEVFIRKIREAYPLSDETVRLLLGHTERVVLPKGELLMREGTVAKYTMFSTAGYENVELLEECDLLKISNETLNRLFDSNIELANWGRRMSDGIILKFEKLFMERYFMSASERYHLLIEREPEILKKVPLRHIASFLGISQVSLSRIRAGIQ